METHQFAVFILVILVGTSLIINIVVINQPDLDPLPSWNDGAAKDFPKSYIGRLNTTLDEAVVKGWTVVSMKDDWKVIYPGKVPVGTE